MCIRNNSIDMYFLNLWYKKEFSKCYEILDSLKKDCQKWFKETMPEATWLGQVAKLEEENQELENAINDDNMTIEDCIEEFADVIIVNWNLETFDKIECIAPIIKYGYERIMNIELDDLKELIPIIKKKIETNKSRRWEYKGNGLYKHIKDYIVIKVGHRYKLNTGDVFNCERESEFVKGGFIIYGKNEIITIGSNGETFDGKYIVEDLGEF